MHAGMLMHKIHLIFRLGGILQIQMALQGILGWVARGMALQHSMHRWV